MAASKLPSSKDLKSFIVSWNIRFKNDRIWRKKYNIPFGSEKHLKANQIDIYLDIIEDELFEEAKKSHIENIEKLKEFNSGKFIREKIISQAEEDALFEKIRLKKK